jgi:ParB family chromosome partitioning protein
MSKQNPPPRKLGRGISSLMNLSPVRVEPPETQTESASNADQSVRTTDGSAGLAAPFASAAGQAGSAAAAVGGLAAQVDQPIVGDDGQLLGVMRHVAIAEISPNQFQPRREFDEAALTELATSIRTLGVVQPVVVRRVSNRKPGDTPYELIAGERRWRAAQVAGLITIPAVVRDASDREAASMAIAENVQRAELNPIEVGAALSRLNAQFHMSHSDIAAEIGLERPTVGNLIRLLELPEAIRTLVATGKISKGHAKVLLAIESDASARTPDQDRRVILARKCAEQGWSIRKLEEEAKRANTPTHALHVEVKPVTRFDANLVDLERQLSEKLATRVKIKPQKGEKGRTRGRIIISYYDLDHFGGVMRKIGGLD